MFARACGCRLQLEYYPDPDKTAEWLERHTGVYPPEARDVLVDYTLNHTIASRRLLAEEPDADLLRGVNPPWPDLVRRGTAQEAMDKRSAMARR